MKSIKSVVIIALVLAVVIGGGYLLDAYFQRGAALAKAIEQVKASEARSAQLDIEISAMAAEISARDTEIKDAVARAVERERWFAAHLATVETATPTQLVDDGSEILGVSDIVTDGKTVQMSVETYRKIVFRLKDHQEYVNVRKPEWDAREELYKAQVSGLSDEISKHVAKHVEDANTIDGLKSIVKNTKTTGFFEKAAWAAGGVAVGFVAGKI